MQSDILHMREQEAARLAVHFDVPAHSLSAEDYALALETLNTCLKELNKRVFDNKLDCELLVFSNEDGSLRAILGVAAKKTKSFAVASTVTIGLIGGVVNFRAAPC